MSKKKLLTYENQLNEMGIKYNRLMNLMKKDYAEVVERDFTGIIGDLNYQQYITRYKWTGLPDYFPSFIIERILYFRGSCCLFFRGGKMHILPFAMTGDLNENGYPTKIQPIAYNGESYLNIRTPYANGTNEPDKSDCTIIYDRVPAFSSSNVIPRFAMDDDIIKLMSKILNRAEINLDNSSKKITYKAESEDQARVVEANVAKGYNSRSPFIVVTDELNGTSDGLFNNGVENECDKIMQFFSAINNFRCYNLGIKNNGMYEKTDRVATGELTGNEYQTNLILEMGLELRKKAIEDLKKVYPEYSDIINKINVEIAEEPFKAKGEDLSEDLGERVGSTAKGGNLNNVV